MAIPTGTKIWPEPMDPYDIMDYQIDCNPLLEDGENIESVSATITADAELMGLQLHPTPGYEMSVTDNIILLWLSIIPAEQGNPAFVTGVTLPIEINIETTSEPTRRKQRTVAVKVVER